MHQQDQLPLQRGFDKYYGVLAGGCNYFEPKHPRGITYGNDNISITDTNYYTTDAFTDIAVKFIKESINDNPNKPFFLYLAYNSPHWPLQAPKEDIDKYRDRYKDGWHLLRVERYKQMIEMGIIDSKWELPPKDSRNWKSLSEERKRKWNFVWQFTPHKLKEWTNIGKLIEFLDKNKIIKYNHCISKR